MIRLEARRYDDRRPVRVTLRDDRIDSIEPVESSGETAAWPLLAPAFFDHQINGFGGVWFSDENLTPQQAMEAAAAQFRFGVARMFPTLITNSFEALDKGFRALRAACEAEVWVDRMFPGFHLEGPYLSGEDGPRGAHPKDQIRPADWDEFQRWQEAADGRIRLVTIAPEVEGALPFIRRAVDSGVVISVGHTAAEPDQITAAADAGASLSTHLGNGAHGVLRRHPNYIWEQLGESRLAAGLITDGHHLPPSVIRSILGVKGVEKTLITCDASGLAGCEPGRYQFESVEVEVLEDGPIVIAGQRQLLAGSGQQTDHCVSHCYAVTDVTLAEAIDMAGNHAARRMGLPLRTLRPGEVADLILLNDPRKGERLTVQATYAAGELKYDRSNR